MHCYCFLQFFNFIVLGYNLRLLHRFGLHPSIWEFIHYLKDEEALVSHRITHLGGGGGITSGTLVYVHMQSKSKATETEKQLIRLQDLYYSNFIGLKENTSYSAMLHIPESVPPPESDPSDSGIPLSQHLNKYTEFLGIPGSDP